MKQSFATLSKRGLAVLGLSLACALPVAAQSTGGSTGSGAGGTGGTSATTGSAMSTADTSGTTTREDRGGMGWIGLLGLAGLLGLRRKTDTTTAHDLNRTNNRGTTSTSR
jgi:hypothetical protein